MEEVSAPKCVVAGGEEGGAAIGWPEFGVAGRSSGIGGGRRRPGGVGEGGEGAELVVIGGGEWLAGGGRG